MSKTDIHNYVFIIFKHINLYCAYINANKNEKKRRTYCRVDIVIQNIGIIVLSESFIGDNEKEIKNWNCHCDILAMVFKSQFLAQQIYMFITRWPQWNNTIGFSHIKKARAIRHGSFMNIPWEYFNISRDEP